ncbi:MAG: HD-GYP domain-containing protein [Chloroflexi bacterium]|nr:HD-GYP domain-containing protein [Chloroflexota bacterium]
MTNTHRHLVTQLYVAVVTLLGFALLLGSLPEVARQPLPLLLFLAGCAGLAQRFPVALFRNSDVSVAFAITFATLLLLGTPAAIWVNLPSALMLWVASTKGVLPAHRGLFNIGSFSLSAATAGLVYSALGGSTPPADFVSALPAMAAAAVTYFAMNSGLTAMAIGLSTHSSVRDVWRVNYAWMVLNYLGLAVNGIALAGAYLAMNIQGMLFFLAPLVIARYSFNLFMAKSREVREQNHRLELAKSQLEESYLNTIAALVAAIDAKDHYTQGHSKVTAHYATLTARAMGLSDREVAGVYLAALFHDIGKIAIPEHILNKPDRLSSEEWETVVQHSSVGSQIIAQITNLRWVAPAIRHHHEHFDGSGYPDHLQGDQIPLTAQILAVADAYQAMRSKRPYRQPRPHQEALAELRLNAGTQFSPQVVEAFVQAISTEVTPLAEKLPLRVAEILHVSQPQF